MSDEKIDNADSEQPLGDAPHHIWQYHAITSHSDAKKGGATRMPSVHFVTKVSGDAARSEQQHIS